MTSGYMVQVLSADEVRLWHVTGNWTAMSTPQRDAASLLVALALRGGTRRDGLRWRLQDSGVPEILDGDGCCGSFAHWADALTAAVQACGNDLRLLGSRQQALAVIGAAREAA